MAEKYAIKSPAERKRIKGEFLSLPGVAWQEKGEQYCEYRLDGRIAGGWLRAKQFTNGTLYLEASADDWLAQLSACVSGESAPRAARLGLGASPASAKPATAGIRETDGTVMGTDESGKGDYFGPLVIAGVVVTDATRAQLKTLGVMDSKKLSASAIVQLAEAIVSVVGAANVAVVEMRPAKYNALYDQFKGQGKNLNHLLAWAHATVIENLLGTSPDCQTLAGIQVIADQFGNEHYIKSQLQEKGRQIQLHQMHRAEVNPAVAAASIVARHRFVQSMQDLSVQFGVELPLGAGPGVKVAARRFLAQHGPQDLHQVAKLHFKTTQELS